MPLPRRSSLLFSLSLEKAKRRCRGSARLLKQLLTYGSCALLGLINEALRFGLLRARKLVVGLPCVAYVACHSFLVICGPIGRPINGWSGAYSRREFQPLGSRCPVRSPDGRGQAQVRDACEIGPRRGRGRRGGIIDVTSCGNIGFTQAYYRFRNTLNMSCVHDTPTVVGRHDVYADACM